MSQTVLTYKHILPETKTQPVKTLNFKARSFLSSWPA